MDLVPTLLTGGGLVALGTLLGGFLEAGRERKRWLRDARIKRYDEFVSAVTKIQQQSRTGVATTDSTQRANEIMNTLGLIGPRRVYVAAQAATKAVADVVNGKQDATKSYAEKLSEFNRQARDVLKVRDN